MIKKKLTIGERYIYFLKNSKLNVLPYLLSKKERRIYNLVKLGVTNSQGKVLSHLKYQRNIIRKILLEKLKEWNDNPTNEPEISYEDILQHQKDKKYKEELET